MTDKHYYNVGSEGDRVYIEFTIRCPKCDQKLMHRFGLNRIQTAQLAVDLITRLGVAEDFQRALLSILGKNRVVIEGDSGVNVQTN